jgi:Flp pilus assembly protein TadD
VRTDPPAAAAIWSHVAAASPDDAYVAFNLGSAVARFDPAAAIALLDRALALDGKNPDAHNNLGNAFLALGRHAEAADAYRRCLELAPGHPQAAANLRVVGEARP